MGSLGIGSAVDFGERGPLLSVLDESSVRIFDSMKGSEEVKGGLGRGPEGVVGLLGLVVPMLGYRF